MASRIDSGVQPTAHTAVQAMIVRAQQVADQTGKAVGVRYDLTSDEITLIEITPETPKEIAFVRIAAPAGRMIAGPHAPGGSESAGSEPSPGTKAAAAA